MSKSILKIKATRLRKAGKSIKEIAKRLGISKSTASVWCRDIELKPAQIVILNERMANKTSYENRLKGARVQHERRLKEIEQLEKDGAKLVGSFNTNQLLYIGIGLYWGEGTKTERTGISNSDPRILILAMRWFEEIFDIKRSYFSCRILINNIHEKRVREIEKYWSKTLNLPKNQFLRTIFIKAKNKKIYSNFNTHYGTVMLRVKKSGDLLHKIKGLMACVYQKALLFS